MEMVLYAIKMDAMHDAQAREKQTGQPHYVARWASGEWEVTDRMPLMGEWYSTDGIRHG